MPLFHIKKKNSRDQPKAGLIPKNVKRDEIKLDTSLVQPICFTFIESSVKCF